MPKDQNGKEEWRKPMSEGSKVSCNTLDTKLNENGEIVIIEKPYNNKNAYQMFKLVYGEDYLTIRCEEGLDKNKEDKQI